MGEAGKIRRLAGARHAPADWIERARIVALSWDGLAVPAIAGRLGCHPNKVPRWLHRFNAAGLDGLGDRPDEAAALAPLALVAGQDVEPAEGSDGRDGRWRIARKVTAGRVVSTVDPQARHARRSSSVLRDGYRARAPADPETGIITSCWLTMDTGDDNADAAVAAQMVAEEAGSPEGPAAWYGYSAYGTRELRAAIADAGHRAVIKPGPLRPSVSGGLTWTTSLPTTRPGP